jgi:hypothetical protein
LEPLKPEHQALFDDLRVIAGKHLLQVRIAFGRAVAHHLYAGSVRVMEDRLAHRGSGLKDFVAACGERLEELGISESLLRQSLAVWSVFVQLPERLQTALLLSHFVALTRVPDGETRGYLAEAAVTNGWSVRELGDAISAVARGAWPDGQPEIPGLQPPGPPAAPVPPAPVVAPAGRSPSTGRWVQRFEKTARAVADVVGDFERVPTAAMSDTERARAHEALGLLIERAQVLRERIGAP